MPTFNGKYVRRCPRGYVKDKKTDMCVAKNKFKLGGGGGSGLATGALGPVNPFTPVDPVVPIVPVVPPQTRDAGGLNTGEIIGIAVGSATALATLSEVIRRYYVDTPNTALNRRLASDDALDYIESQGLTDDQLADAGYTINEYGNGEQELVALRPRTLVQRSSGTRTNVNVDTIADSQGAIRNPQDMRDDQSFERFIEEQRQLREGTGDIELTDATAIDIDLPVAQDVLPSVPKKPAKKTGVIDDISQGAKTMLEDFQARTSSLTPQRMSQFVKDLDIQGGLQDLFGTGGSGRNKMAEPKPEQSDIFPQDVVGSETQGEFVFGDNEETPLMGRGGLRRRRTAGSGAAETSPLIEEPPQGGAPSDTIDDADLDVPPRRTRPPTRTLAEIQEEERRLGTGSRDVDFSRGEGGGRPYEDIIEEASETGNIKYKDSDFIPDNLIKNPRPSRGAEQVFGETDLVQGVIERAAIESGFEEEVIGGSTRSAAEMIVGGLTNGLEVGSGVVDGIGGLFTDVIAAQSADVLSGLAYAGGIASQGAEFTAAALAGDVSMDALVGAMASGMGGMIAGLADVALAVALPVTVVFGALVTIDSFLGTNLSGLGLNDQPPSERPMEMKYAFNKAFETLGIPLELMGASGTRTGEALGFFMWEGEIYPMSDLNTLLPEAFANNPDMRRNINFTIERIYEASSFKYNNTELQEQGSLGKADMLGDLSFDELIALERPLKKILVAEITSKVMSLQQEFNDFKGVYDDKNYTSFEDHADFIKHKFRQQRGGLGVKANILNGGTGVVATAFGGDVNKLNQVLNRMHYMEEATYGYEGVSVDRPHLKPAELVVQGYIDQLISTAKVSDPDTLTKREQAIVGQQNIEGLGTGEANAIGRTEDPDAIPIQESAYSKLEPTYGQETQPFQFAPESEMNPTPTRQAPSSKPPAEA